MGEETKKKKKKRVTMETNHDYIYKKYVWKCLCRDSSLDQEGKDDYFSFINYAATYEGNPENWDRTRNAR